MAASLKEVLEIVSANSETAIDNLMDLMRPDAHTREEMQAIYEDSLGYDPTTWYDEVDIRRIAKYIAEKPDTPQTVTDYINESKEELVKTAFRIFEENREMQLQICVEQAIEEKTGISVNVKPEYLEDDSESETDEDDVESSIDDLDDFED